MFRENIKATRLTTEFANRYFLNITGDSFRGDTTFTATLRALCGSRVPVGESIRLTIGENSFSAKTISETNPTEMVWYLTRQMNDIPGGFYIHNLIGSEADNTSCINILRDNFAKVYEGWRELEKISIFYKKSFGVVCFVNPITKSVAIFVDRLNLQKWHYLQVATVAVMPWYFRHEDKNPLNKYEQNLLISLCDRSADKYVEQIKVIAGQYDK